ncbi:MAG: histidine kinase N-terminal 7TM domain-containing protein [Roseiflexus sp.]
MSFLLLTLSVAALGIAGYAWQHRSTQGASALGLMGLGVAVWLSGYTMQLSSLSFPLALWWIRFQFAGIVALPVAWLWFAAEYTGSLPWLHRRRVWLLGIVPMLTMSIMLTNDMHGLFWQSITLNMKSPFTLVEAVHGVWFWIHIAYSYLCLLGGVFVLLRFIPQVPGLFYGQVGMLLMVVVAPLLANGLDLMGIRLWGGLDLTPFGFTVSLIALAWILFRLRLFEIRPIVRDMVLQSMSDGVMVVDENRRIIEVNSAAAMLIGLPPAQIVGKHARDVLQRWPQVLERYRAVLETTEEIEVMDGTEQRWFDVRILPIYDVRRIYRGRLFVWRDVSEERRIREELQRNNEHLLAVQRELIAARDAAEAGNRAKSAFLAHMSHEIRTPLTAIAGYCHLLETGIEHQSLAQTRADLEAIRVATGHLLDLANNVLEMAQIESGRVEVHDVAFNVAEIVEDVAATVRPLLRRNRNRLVIVGTDEVGIVQGDAAKVRQVLLNLVNNAAKFTTDGEVEVGVAYEAAEEERMRLRFWVRDTGKGITPEQMATLFIRFSIAEENIGREQRGAGLGLAISQYYCRLMGGELTIESTPGVGTLATFWIPVCVSQVTAVDVSDELKDCSISAHAAPVCNRQ